MKRIIEPLTRMGAGITATEGGRPPLEITGGPLKAIHYELPVASAQVKSAVLLAGLYADGATTVVEPAATRDHTEIALEQFGAAIERQFRTVSVAGGISPSRPAPCTVTVSPLRSIAIPRPARHPSVLAQSALRAKKLISVGPSAMAPSIA